MVRRTPTLLLVLVMVAACAPASGSEPSAPVVAAASPLVASPTAMPPRPAPSTDALPHVLPPPVDPPLGELVAPSPTPALSPAASVAPPPVEPRSARRLSFDLASAADFVPQYTSYWCVGASLQMTRSIITGDRNETRRSQRMLWRMARDRSLDSPYGGANPQGWTAALNDLGLGPYRLVSRPSFADAVRTAARALAETGKPVGLVMWAGRHAWVMTGFESRGHPRRDDARVTGVRVMDPLYPGRTRWGRSPAPNQLIELETLARQFVIRNRPDYDFGVAPGWLLVLPTG